MSKNRETLPLIVALLSTALLIAGGLWWFFRITSRSVVDAVDGDVQSSQPARDLPNRFSTGERLLTPSAAGDAALQAQRQAGATAFAAKNYAQAVAEFEAVLKAKRNDPESLIYLNNAQIADRPAYEIAVSVPIGGTLDTALEMLRGVAQAQTEFNSQNPAVPLKVLISDDGYSPAIARQIATALVDNPNVLGVVGHHSSDMSLAAGEVYTQGKLAMISPVSTSVKLSNFSPYVFRTVPSDFVAARALARYMVSQNQQKAAVFFNSQSAYSQSIKSEFGSALSLEGGQVVSEFDLSSPSFDPTSSFRQAVQQGATTLALLPDSGQLDRALQVVQVNQRQLKILGGDSVYSPKLLAISGAAAEDTVIAVPWHILANQNSPFVKLSRQLWGADVNWRTTMSYDATTAFIAALTAQPNPTRESVQAALSNANFLVTNGSGSVKFLPSGDRNQPIQLVTVAPGRRSGYSYDFVPLP
jgi:branched-chain amino acid transport system substrate-binding protein